MTQPSPLLEALLAFQENAPALQKDAVNPHFKNRYVSLDSLTQTITPLLCEQNLVWTTLPCTENGAPALRYQLAHAPSGEKLEGVMPLMLSKNDAQSLGSALTYARRYAVSAVLGLSAEDDDGAKASAPRLAMASIEDVQAMEAASAGLSTADIRRVLGKLGVSANGWREVPAARALEVTKALAQAAAS